MAITFGCACGKTYQLSDDKAGKKAKCGQCGKEFEVPQPDAPPPPADDDSLAPVDDYAVENEPSRAAAPTPPASAAPFPAPSFTPPPAVTTVDAVAPPTRGQYQYDPTQLNRNLFFALIAGGIVAGIMGFIWFVVVMVTGFQFGVLAWGIGGLLGFVVTRLTPERSMRIGVLAAVMAFGSIMLGKGLMYGTFSIARYGVKFMSDPGAAFLDITLKEYDEMTGEQLVKRVPEEVAYVEWLMAVEDGQAMPDELRAWINDRETRLRAFRRMVKNKGLESYEYNLPGLGEPDPNEDRELFKAYEAVEFPPFEMEKAADKLDADIRARRESLKSKPDELRDYLKRMAQTQHQKQKDSNRVNEEVFPPANDGDGKEQRLKIEEAKEELDNLRVFSFFDIIWFFLAIGTAFRMGHEGAMKRS